MEQDVEITCNECGEFIAYMTKEGAFSQVHVCDGCAYLYMQVTYYDPLYGMYVNDV